MPNGFEQFASGAMALGNQWRQQRKDRKLAAAMGQFDADPNAAVAGVTAVDPVMGYNMRRQITADAQAAQELQRTHATEALKTVTGLLRPAAEAPGATPESISAAYDAVVPMLHDGLGMQPDEIAKWKQMVVANPSILRKMDDKLQVVPPGASVVRGGKEVYHNAMGPKTMAVKRADGGYDVIQIDQNGNPVVPTAASPAAAASGGPTTADQAWAFTSKHEGGYNPSDANGAPVNYGINQTANPGVDVKNLTEPQARQIFEKKYFGPSGAANMPPALGTLHADTYYINPERAQEFLKQSGGDPQKYLQLRASWQDNLVKNDPNKYGKYAHAWDNRNQDLARTISAAPAASGVTPVYSTSGKGSGGNVGRFLSDKEVADNNLNPNVRWQYNHVGDVVMVGPANQLSKTTLEAQQKRSAQFEDLTSNIDRMKQTAAELSQHPGLERATGEMSYFPSIRGGDAANFEASLESLKSQIMNSVLASMRAASPTGAALGRVTNFEAKTLQANLAALNLSQSPAQFRASLKKIQDYADTLKSRVTRAYNVDSSGGKQQQQGGTAAAPREAIDALRSNPSPVRRQQFDQIFGNGAAKRALGGGR